MDKEALRTIAAKEELPLNFVAKDEIISMALVALQNSPKEILIILKGGTAINRVYVDNKRFSEDIDFDLIFLGTVKMALKQTEECMKAVKMNPAFDVQRPRIMKNTIRYYVSYTNPLGQKDKIRVEFSVKKHALPYSKTVVNFGIVPAHASLHFVYTIEELIKQKIDCLLNRLEGKDFFDFYYLLEKAPPHLKEIVSFRDDIIKRLTIEEEKIKYVANIVNHYIPRNKRPLWGLFLEELKEKIEKYR